MEGCNKLLDISINEVTCKKILGAKSYSMKKSNYFDLYK